MVSREPPSLGIGCPGQVSARGPPFAILVKNALPGLLLTSVSDGRGRTVEEDTASEGQTRDPIGTCPL